MTSSTPAGAALPGDTGSQDRFGPIIERADGVDLPYYDGRPVGLSGARWGGLVLSVLLTITVLSVWPFGERWGLVAGQVLFLLIPLVALMVLVPQHWTALWRRFRARDLGVVLAYWLLTLAVQAVVGLALRAVDSSAGADPAAAEKLTGSEAVLHFAGSLPQLMGEELLAILPLLAVLWLGYTKLGWSRRTSIVVAVVVSSIWFGLVHLPTYDWNVLQAVVGIGLVRVPLTLAFIRTKNLWVSFGSHVLVDWLIFLNALA